MADTVVELVPQLEDTDDETVHWACCDDFTIALCGKDLSREEEVDWEVNCNACIELFNVCEEGTCPVQTLRDLLDSH